jgi:hypothetical protein
MCQSDSLTIELILPHTPRKPKKKSYAKNQRTTKLTPRRDYTQFSVPFKKRWPIFQQKLKANEEFLIADGQNITWPAIPPGFLPAAASYSTGSVHRDNWHPITWTYCLVAVLAIPGSTDLEISWPMQACSVAEPVVR